jgi:putative peptidoglycan lipid II flippase
MVAYALSQILGLARWILMSRYFGTSSEADAFNAARQLSDILFSLVAGGALSSAFIPIFTGFLVKEDHRGAWRMASAVANLVTLILAGLSALAAVFAPFLVAHVLAPDFSPQQQTLTVALLRIVLPSAVIFGLSGLLMGVLNAQKSFFLPALSSSMYWLGMIFGIVALRPTLGIYGPAWGALLGSVLHLAVQIPALIRLPNRRYSLTLGVHLPEVGEMLRLMGPRLFGVAVVQLNSLINVNMSSNLTGGITSIGQAFSIMTVPLFVVAQGIATASFPTFSAQVAQGKLDEMRHTLAASLRAVILLMLPAAAGMILLREPLVAFLFERGEFTHESTLLVAWALLWYAVGLPGHSMIEVIYRGFYALHNTKTPVLVGAGAMGLNVVFSLLFVPLFRRLGWMPHGGLALANSLATLLEMTLALILLRRKLEGIGGQSLASGLVQALVGSALMAAGVFGWLSLTAALPFWLVALGGVVVGGAIYALTMVVMRVPEVALLAQMVLRRIRKANP